MSFQELSGKSGGDSSERVRERVITARKIQHARFENRPGMNCNAQMDSKWLKEHCAIDDAGKRLLATAMERLKLSARAYDRILKVARTIADLSASERIESQQLAEAIQYRSLDRENWAG